MHNMIIRCLSVEITYVTDCSLGVRLYHDISAVIIGILRAAARARRACTYRMRFIAQQAGAQAVYK